MPLCHVTMSLCRSTWAICGSGPTAYQPSLKSEDALPKSASVKRGHEARPMDLLKWLEGESSQLHTYVKTVKYAVTPLLKNPIHRQYTDHSVEHSYRVIEHLNQLTDDLMQDHERCLSANETYILLAAAYLHDIGMQDERHAVELTASLYGGALDKSYNGMREIEFYYLEQIRERHHEYTRKMIEEYLEERNEYVKIGLPRIDVLDELVGLVAEAHRQVDIYQSTFCPVYHAKAFIRPRLLAALLRLADGLDIDYSRVDMERLKLMIVPPDSQLHWYLCYYVSGVEIAGQDIRIHYRLPKKRPHYRSWLEPLIERKIRSELEYLHSAFESNGLIFTMDSSEPSYHMKLEPLPSQVEHAADDASLRAAYDADESDASPDE